MTRFRADGRATLVRRGKNRDVIEVLMETYRLYKGQCAPLVEALAGEDEETALQTVFQYVLENVRYREDPMPRQDIKTPARLLADGVGDCKSMALFIASCLHCLGIPFVFRFVSFNGTAVYSHVYIVARPGTEWQRTLDPVERVDREPVYDYARPYTLKLDIRG